MCVLKVWVYFGSVLPTIWNLPCLETIVEFLLHCFKGPAHVEVAHECNGKKKTPVALLHTTTKLVLTVDGYLVSWRFHKTIIKDIATVSTS